MWPGQPAFDTYLVRGMVFTTKYKEMRSAHLPRHFACRSASWRHAFCHLHRQTRISESAKYQKHIPIFTDSAADNHRSIDQSIFTGPIKAVASYCSTPRSKFHVIYLDYTPSCARLEYDCGREFDYHISRIGTSGPFAKYTIPECCYDNIKRQACGQAMGSLCCRRNWWHDGCCVDLSSRCTED